MPSRPLTLLLLSALALTACRERALNVLSTDLSVPEALDFGVVYVGFTRAQALELSNRGRALVEFQVRAPAPFSAPQIVRVPGGTSVELELQLTAQTEGPMAGTLRLEADGLTFEVALTGVGALPPACTPSSDCVEARFDPASGCVERPAAEGASCGANDRCLTGGHCQQGTCVGEAVSCDDANACTADACSAAVGCLHQPVQCAQPGGACEVAFCEPTLGCGLRPAEDGARCGSNDCQTAHVCIAGACEERPAPDGSECGEATTCRGAGSCLLGACTAPPPHVPTPRWRYTPPADMNLMRVVADTHGNTFALLGTSVVYGEDAGPPPYELWLYSFDADGNLRFAVNLTQQTPGIESGVALMADPDADLVYLAARTYNYGTATVERVAVAQARSASTGARLWEHDLHHDVPITNSSDGQMSLEVTRMMLLSPSVLSLALVEGESLHQAHVVGLSTATGVEFWHAQRGGHLGAGATANGAVWEASAACWSSETFVSHLSSTGVSSPRQLLSASLLAFGEDRAVIRTQAVDQLAWLSERQVLTPIPLLPQRSLSWGSQVRLEGSLLTVVTQDAQSQSQSSLDRYDSASGAWQWSAPLGAGSVSQLWLLRDGGTATSLSNSDGGTELVTHSATGEELERCPYGTASGVTVTNGAYVTQEGRGITVFDLPGRDSATSGWTGPDGYAGTGRAR